MAAPADEAIAMIEQVTPGVERTAIPSSIGTVLFARGIALAKSDPAAALVAFDRAIHVARASGNRFLEATVAPEMAALQADLGDPVAALHSFRQTLDGRGGSTDRAFIGPTFGGLVRLFERLGRADAAAIVHGTLINAFASANWIRDLPTALARLRDTLGDARLRELQWRGAALTLQEAADYAQALIREALRALGAGDG